MIDNESQKKRIDKKKWNASSWKTWFSLVRCYYYWLSNIFSRLLTNKQTNICTLPSVLRKNRKNVKSLKKRAFDFFVEFVLLCCLLSFLRPLKVKKKETKLRLLQPFLITRLGIKRRDKKKEMGRFISRANYFIILLLA